MTVVPLADRFDQTYFSDRYGTPFDRWALYTLDRELEPHVRFLTASGRGGTVLDLGCGLGRSLDALRRSSDQAVGADISHFALLGAAASGHHVLQAGVEHLPFPSETFDGLMMRDVLDLIPAESVSVVLAEVRRVLKPGGRLLVEVMNWAHPRVKATFRDDPHHCTPFTAETLLEAMNAAGFGGAVHLERTITGLPGLGLLVRANRFGLAHGIARAHAAATRRLMHAVFYGWRPAE